MKTKAFSARLKLLGEPGQFEAIFSRFNVVDKHGDVTLPGAFTEGQAVRISSWGHKWQDLPVGRGTIHQTATHAYVKGRFFLDTTGGRETYQTVKNLSPDLQEWSYGYDVLESEPGAFQSQKVTFLKKLTVFEVSPVLIGAGVDTMTTAIKSAGSDLSPWGAMRDVARLWPMHEARAISPRDVKAMLDEADAIHTRELLRQVDEFEAKFRKMGGPSHLDALAQRLRADGHSDAWIGAMLAHEVDSLAWQLEAGNPAKTWAFPGWGYAEARRRLQSPTR